MSNEFHIALKGGPLDQTIGKTSEETWIYRTMRNGVHLAYVDTGKVEPGTGHRIFEYREGVPQPFVITIREGGPEGPIVGQGPSYDREDWKTALLRLWQRTRDDSDARTFVPGPHMPFYEPPEPNSGRGVVVLCRPAGPPGGMTHPLEFVYVETEPAQF